MQPILFKDTEYGLDNQANNHKRELYETYATNDAEGKYFPTRVSVDFHLKEPVLCGYERFNSMDEALAYFARVLKRDTLTVDDIHKWNCEHWKDGFIYFNEYEVDLR